MPQRSHLLSHQYSLRHSQTTTPMLLTHCITHSEMHCTPRLTHSCFVPPSNQSAAVPVTRFGLLSQATYSSYFHSEIPAAVKWLPQVVNALHLTSHLTSWFHWKHCSLYLLTYPGTPEQWAYSLLWHSTLNFTSCEGGKQEGVKKGSEIYSFPRKEDREYLCQKRYFRKSWHQI